MREKTDREYFERRYRCGEIYDKLVRSANNGKDKGKVNRNLMKAIMVRKYADGGCSCYSLEDADAFLRLVEQQEGWAWDDGMGGSD